MVGFDWCRCLGVGKEGIFEAMELKSTGPMPLVLKVNLKRFFVLFWVGKMFGQY